MPCLVVGLPLYVLAHYGRRDFVFSTASERVTRPTHKTEWNVVSANLTLLPESVAKRYGLRHTLERARHSAVRIMSAIHTTANKELHREMPIQNTLMHFPTADFVCFQGVHDHNAYDRLQHALNIHFPYILGDPGVWVFRKGRLVMGSGLMLASKYPIMAARYVEFARAPLGRHGRSQGVLQAKIFLSKKRRTRVGHRRTVAYIHLTHLKMNMSRKEKAGLLDQLEKHVADFRHDTHVMEHEVVGFQILAGDLGFDNTGTDSACKHPILRQYHDVFRQSVGKDVPHSIGTRLQPQQIALAQEPRLLRNMLLDPEERAHLIQPCTHHDTRRSSRRASELGDSDALEMEAQAKVPGAGRTSYVLLQHATPPQLPAHPQQTNVITALAGQACHLPVHLMFTLGESDDSHQTALSMALKGSSAPTPEPDMPAMVWKALMHRLMLLGNRLHLSNGDLRSQSVNSFLNPPNRGIGGGGSSVNVPSLAAAYVGAQTTQNGVDDDDDLALFQTHFYRGCIRIGTTKAEARIDELDLDSASATSSEGENSTNFVVDVSEV
ncbi:uncharacterized protein MONBRDRAFT_29438 [Monosiga brevicollis MX1]|uniref:Sphingomyelin phosphodiesterase n=1 Tax=Monosiga brevicollis TaxID=81824 RepID=A9VB36_MONBE|nr:uncharacterized protein MONBRDRAFT_29438 [Monosiga brevicollis MX1]EDQ85323.1 predicted protein [Monosiga brevicollis MX1]|eukprot:XP_001749944.1 hypothetical protein [Monosiga brevicollis MX1]